MMRRFGFSLALFGLAVFAYEGIVGYDPDEGAAEAPADDAFSEEDAVLLWAFAALVAGALCAGERDEEVSLQRLVYYRLYESSKTRVH